MAADPAKAVDLVKAERLEKAAQAEPAGRQDKAAQAEPADRLDKAAQEDAEVVKAGPAEPRDSVARNKRPLL